MNLEKIKAMIRNVPDFPKAKIQFKDITPVLQEPKAFAYLIDTFAAFASKHHVNAIVAPEARGFIFGAALAYHLQVKFVPARKAGKLPAKTFQAKYDLEYNSAILEIHQDALQKNDKVMIIDDLVATAGTLHACMELVKQTPGRVVCLASLISLTELKAYQNFNDVPYLNLIEL